MCSCRGPAAGDSIYRRYDIVSHRDLTNAAKLESYFQQQPQAQQLSDNEQGKTVQRPENGYSFSYRRGTTAGDNKVKSFSMWWAL